MENYLIELSIPKGQEINRFLSQLNEFGFKHDSKFSPKRMRTPMKSKEKQRYYNAENDVFLIKGQVDKKQIERIEKLNFVIKCWYDTKIAPHFCNCNNGRKKTLEKIAECIGANELWNLGVTGSGISVGIVDGGIDSSVISQCTNGHLPDWGTIANWDEHGHMTATDAIGIAPDIEIFDLRIATPNNSTDSVSNAIDAFDWAITNFINNGTPQILSNSWGIYQESWDPDYATDIDHPFTRIVEDAINQGIAVVFSAGNCGETCPDSRCDGDTGGGRDIWGANGHPEVMTVGAVNYNWKRLKYSSQGPAALDQMKPDFCGYSNFKGYFNKDSGTSAACPVVSGCVALLLSSDNQLQPQQIKDALINSALDIENPGWDANTGHGIVRINKAYYNLNPEQLPEPSGKDKICTFVHRTRRVCSEWADEGSEQCNEWADEGSEQCSEWADEGSEQCISWERCKWYTPWNCIAGFFCRAFHWVSNWVCQAVIWVANWVCKVVIWVANWVCKAFTTIVTIVTLTNCKCRTKYVDEN